MTKRFREGAQWFENGFDFKRSFAMSIPNSEFDVNGSDMLIARFKFVFGSVFCRSQVILRSYTQE